MKVSYLKAREAWLEYLDTYDPLDESVTNRNEYRAAEHKFAVAIRHCERWGTDGKTAEEFIIERKIALQESLVNPPAVPDRSHYQRRREALNVAKSVDKVYDKIERDKLTG